MNKIIEMLSRIRGRGGEAEPPQHPARENVRRMPVAGRSNRPPEETVGFHFGASDRIVGIGNDERLHRAVKAFAPSQPVLDVAEFAGRHTLLQQLVTAVEEHRNHLVIFGGRGTGKTSIAMALLSVARRAGYTCAYTSCGRDNSLHAIFASALANLSIRYDERFDPRDEDASASATFADLLHDQISVQELIDVLARIRGTRLLVVIDEFDRNENPTLTRDMTETMKVLSDRAINCQVVIVGVGNVSDTLVGEHASVARALFPARITAMGTDEIRDTIHVAARNAGVEFAPDVVDTMTTLASGRPFTARLIGLKAAKIALLRDSRHVVAADLDIGVSELLTYLVSAGFGEIERLARSSSLSLVVFSAILSCHRDAFDRFSPADVAEALTSFAPQRDMTAPISNLLGLMASPEFGVLLAEPGDGTTLYRFSDPRAEILVSLTCWRARLANAGLAQDERTGLS